MLNIFNELPEYQKETILKTYTDFLEKYSNYAFQTNSVYANVELIKREEKTEEELLRNDDKNICSHFCVTEDLISRLRLLLNYNGV